MFGQLPDVVVACVGGGSNAMGIFHPFIQEQAVRLIGVEPAGRGIETGEHAAPLSRGEVGVLHGNRTYLMQDKNGQILDTHSISAGLDYPGVGPEHSWLKDTKRAEYVYVDDQQASDAFRQLNLLEGILPALESAHALAYGAQMASQMSTDKIVIINLSGRGDKDIPTIAKIDGISIA
jgi:tryptophan synthase beta chain